HSQIGATWRSCCHETCPTLIGEMQPEPRHDRLSELAHQAFPLALHLPTAMSQAGIPVRRVLGSASGPSHYSQHSRSLSAMMNQRSSPALPGLMRVSTAIRAMIKQAHLRLEPDPGLVTEAQRITTGANIHTIRQSLLWYEHWCQIGNRAAAEVSAKTLRAEIAKARRGRT